MSGVSIILYTPSCSVYVEFGHPLDKQFYTEKKYERCLKGYDIADCKLYKATIINIHFILSTDMLIDTHVLLVVMSTV